MTWASYAFYSLHTSPMPTPTFPHIKCSHPSTNICLLSLKARRDQTLGVTQRVWSKKAHENLRFPHLAQWRLDSFGSLIICKSRGSDLDGYQLWHIPPSPTSPPLSYLSFLPKWQSQDFRIPTGFADRNQSWHSQLFCYTRGHSSSRLPRCPVLHTICGINYSLTL